MKRTRTALGLAAAGLLAASGAHAAGDEGKQPAAQQGTMHSEGTGTHSEKAMHPEKGMPSAMHPEKGMPSEKGESYVVREGDTLATIAEDKLGSSEQWTLIAKANSIDDPQDLRVGQKLVIPERQEAGRTGQAEGRRDASSEKGEDSSSRREMDPSDRPGQQPQESGAGQKYRNEYEPGAQR